MAGLSTVSDDWQSITSSDVINGLKYNTDFVLDGFEPVYFIGDKSIKSSYANDTIQNCTQILANLLRSNDNLTIKTFEATGENKYNVGKCSNIQYVARYIDSKIESITSTSVCDIPLDVSEKIGKYDTRFTSNALGGQLICRITSNDVEYLRAFTISGQEITLLDIVTGATSAIATLAVDDRFELINAYDILEEGLEETTGYPVQGFVKKHVKPNEDTSFVEFGKYDTPAKLSGEKVVIAYNALDDYNQTFIYDSSIDQYGIFTKKEDLNFALTQSQLTFIETTLKKFIEPNIVIELETFRPSKPLKGWNVNVNIPEFDLVGIFKITRVSEVFIYETGQLIDKPFRLWKVTLSNYENNLAQLLAGLKKKNDSKAKLATNQVLRTAMTLDLQFKWIDDPSEFTLDAPTAYDATNVTADDFEANWSYVANANDYIIFVALDAGFTIPVSGFAGLLVGNITTRLIDGQDVTDNDTFYYKVKAINTELGLESDWSNVITVEKSETFDFIMPSGKTAGLLWNEASMIGSGTNINDLVNNNDGTLSNSTSWISDTKWIYGVDLESVNISIAHNTNYKSFGASAKFADAYVLRLNTITNNSTNPLWITQNAGTGFNFTEINLIYNINGSGQLFLTADFLNSARSMILRVNSNAVSVSAGQDIFIAFYVDLANNQVKFVLNGVELTSTVDTSFGFFYTSIANYVSAGGIPNDSQTVYMYPVSNYSGGHAKATIWRKCTAIGSNTPSIAELIAQSDLLI